MDIHLVSSLTPDDESRLAPKVLAAIGAVLDRLPVTYAIRIETIAGNAILRNRTAPENGEVPHPDALMDALESPAG